MDKIFKAFADLNRRKILTLLMKKDMAVLEMLKFFDITQATLSCHLAVLRKAKLVEVEVKGKQRIYKINREVLLDFGDRFKKFLGEEETQDHFSIEVRHR